MRCKFCGSNIIHPDKQHKTFSTGKAVAGAVAFGVVGAVTGFIGKDIDGYRCGACGAFMDAPMDFATEMSVDNAIRDAESGGSRAMFDYFKSQYGNIQANIPAAPAQKSDSEPPAVSISDVQTPAVLPKEIQASKVKHSYRTGIWDPDCPIFVEIVIIKATEDDDVLSLVAWNQSSKAVRSAYYQVKVFDDTGDEISTCQCVYQGLATPSGEALPVTKEFELDTDLAYRVELHCEKIAMEDGTVWRASENDARITLPEPTEITSQNFPRLKWLKRFLKSYSAADPNGSLYLPAKQENFWQCICGIPVKRDCKCPHCGADYQKLEELVSQKELQARQQAIVKAVAERRAKTTTELYNNAIEHHKNETYDAAICLQKKDTEADLNEAAQLFDSISDWKDSAERAQSCRDRIPVLKAELEQKAEEEKRKAEEKAAAEAQREKLLAEERRQKTRKVLPIIISLAVVVVVVLVTTTVIIPNWNYNTAVSLMESGDYDGAIAAFEKLGEFKDSAAMMVEAENRSIYATALNDMESGNYTAAIEGFTSLGDYSDAADMINATYYAKAESLVESGDYDAAIEEFTALGNYSDAADRINATYYAKAESLVESGDYDAAIEGFTALGNYSDAADRINATYYAKAESLVESGKNADAAISFAKAKSYYLDARSRSLELWEAVAQRATISAGGYHTVGLKSDGTVVAVGDNSDGQCDVSDWTDIVAIAAGSNHTIGLKSDGTVVAVGHIRYGQCDVSGWTDIVAINATGNRTVGLKSDGTVVAAGDNEYGQGDVSGWTDIVAIAAGACHTVGLKSDGTVVAVGYNGSGQCNVSGWTNIVDIAARGGNTVGLKSDGTVVAVGDNEYSQCDVSGWKDIVAIAAGTYHTVGLKSDGTILTMGNNDAGQRNVSGWTNIVSIATGPFNTVGLKSDGTVVAATADYFTSVKLSGKTVLVVGNHKGQCDVSSWKDIKIYK
jgi:hypothetical protein